MTELEDTVHDSLRPIVAVERIAAVEALRSAANAWVTVQDGVWTAQDIAEWLNAKAACVEDGGDW